MGADRPINADVPAPEPERDEPAPRPEPGPKPQEKPGAGPPQPPRRRRRRPVPGAIKMIAALVAVAVAFIVVAVLAGGGQPKKGATETPGPVVAAPSSSGGSGDGVPASAPAEELGYPAFATNNTTRVGGSDPAATAAAVALAVFPATSPSQRPAAVTLVDEGDWAGGIAAAVLMAAPVRAPVLFSKAGALPDATAQALSALDPTGDRATAGAGAFAIGDAASPQGTKATRVGGGSAAALAANVAALRDRLFGSPPRAFVIAPSAQPEIAMPAAAWAARSGDPVLFTDPERLPKPTAAALERHPKVPVYVLGPPAAISTAVLHEIADIDESIRRVSGSDAVTNAIAFARYRDGGFGWDVNDPGHGFVLARSDSPLDAVAAAPLSASGTWGPLLLTDDAGTLPAQLRNYLLDVKPGYTNNPTRAFYNHVWVIGDQEAIDVNQQAEVNQVAELAKIGGEP